jgi:glycosyltransferase involved in cell wall biosynthesis
VSERHVAARPLRIALTIGTLNVGGAETQLCRLAVELAERGHEVKVFVVIQAGPLASVLDDAGIPYVVARFPGFVYRDPERGLILDELARSFVYVFQLWRALWRFDPDVCQAYLPWAYMLTIPGAAIGRVPVRISARRSLPSGLGLRARERVLQWVASTLSHRVVANSTEVARETAELEPVTRRKLAVIANGVDLPEAVADPAVQPATGVVVASLIRYKGHQDLIDALQLLPAPPAIELVGDGPERDVLERSVKEAGLEHVISFAGALPDGRRRFERAQFAVLPSHQEGMPNAVLEAMACGLPVVATAVGGVVDLIDDGSNGLLVPPHDPERLADAIARLVADPDLRVRLGHAARAKASRFSWSRCADSHLDLYRTVACDHGRALGVRR